MKKLLEILAFVAILLLGSCGEYDHVIADHDDRLDQLEESFITSVKQQMTAIGNSIKNLETVDKALDGYIKALETQAAELQKQLDENLAADASDKKALEDEILAINVLLEELKAKDAELDKKIDDLKKYLGGEIDATKDWAEATFATLEQYSALQTEISAIKTLMEGYGDEISADLEESIDTLEKSMKYWVNAALAEGYYDMAEIDAKLAAVKSELADGDKELQKQLEDQLAAFEQAKNDLIKAYTDAISEAIETNNGLISKIIADELQKAMDKVDSRLADIENDIAAIWRDIENIKSDIASIEQQIKGINSSIADLKAVDVALKALIDNLTSEAVELQAQLDKNAEADAETKKALQDEIDSLLSLIKALQANDAELDKKIADLKKYTDEQIGGTEDWAESTFATLEQYSLLQTEVATIAALLEQHKSEHSDVSDGAITDAIAEIEDAIETLEVSMKTWVNELLAEGYYDIAAIDAKLSALEQKLSDADADLADELEAQQAALEQAKTDLTKAYEKAIKEAIEKNSGKITEDIADAVKAAEERLEAKITAINAEIESIKDLIESLEETVNDLVARIQSMRFIPEYSDGKVAFGLGASTAELTFMVSPNDAAAGVAAAWVNSKKVVTAFIKPTQPRTKASYDMVPLAVTYVTDNKNGTLGVTISAEYLGEDFWYEGMEANVFVCISDGNNDIVSEMIPIYYVGTPYVTFKASAAQTLNIDVDVDGLQFSTDKGATWHSLTTSTDNATFGPDNDLLLRGINSGGTGNATISFTNSSVPVACSGDIRTLVDYSNYAKVNTSSAKFAYLFSNCEVLTSAPALPATTLASACYSNMFNGCTGLTKAPSLPATQLAEYCYNAMFYGCTSLMEAPELPATDLAESCYYCMFEDCTSLTSAPELPATDLAESCYYGMFMGCTSLTSAPELPATDLAEFCYYGMFKGCTSLTSAPELPAETLATSCYEEMFSFCESLTSAPALPAETLAESCYSLMFFNCILLTSAPALPATDLAEFCYYGMFSGCIKLEIAPELPAKTLAEACYWQMFYFCTELSNIKMLATDVSATKCLDEWVSNVATTGTFTKVAGVSLSTGISGIPDGWTVIQEASTGVNDAPDFGFGGSFSN